MTNANAICETQLPVRGQAAWILHQVLQGTPLESLWEDWAPGPDVAFLREVVYGTLRFYPRLSLLLSWIASRRQPDSLIQALALSSLYQLLHLRVPVHATVHESVEAAQALGYASAQPFINAILRRVIRERAWWNARLDDSEIGRYAYPPWWLDLIQKNWPDNWPDLLLAGNARAPMTLRINLSRISREDYLQSLKSRGIGGRLGELAATALVLEKPLPVDEIPGFSEGLVTVQDEAAQLAIPLLEPGPGMRILDACAAPGGKTTHLLEHTRGDVILDAIDRDAGRLEKVQKNIARCGYSVARLLVRDALETSQFYQGIPYDRILLDVPCTGSGVVRRHPDIKVTRSLHSVNLIRIRQQALLESLWPLLNRGGRLLYVTCSLFEVENDEVIGSFLEGHKDAHLLDSCPRGTHQTHYGCISLTGEWNQDGFFFASLAKSG